jgi:uncharacterized protein (DUF697 family)/tellurite resistance protein
MLSSEQNALLNIAMLAAFADGTQDDRERAAIKATAESLAGDLATPALATLYQDVLLKRVDLRQAASALTQDQHRRLAYETAVCVCDADGATTPAERAFLDELRSALGLDSQRVAQVEQDAAAMSSLPATALHTDAAAPASATSDAELDSYILHHAIMNGAIELLPQSLASMAIIPLQMKMIYRIGQRYGHELDQNYIREFIATAGVGLTSQYLEQFGRKLLGGLLGSVVGGLGRGVGSVATGAAFSFATTYALGHLAKRYYAGGREMNAALLRSTYEQLLADAKQLQQQNLSQIREKARTLDVSQILSMVKGA